jgi:hypothetical protein
MIHEYSVLWRQEYTDTGVMIQPEAANIGTPAFVISPKNGD